MGFPASKVAIIGQEFVEDTRSEVVVADIIVDASMLFVEMTEVEKAENNEVSMEAGSLHATSFSSSSRSRAVVYTHCYETDTEYVAALSLEKRALKLSR